MAADSTTIRNDELAKRQALNRTKAIATASLALCVIVFLTARAFQDDFPFLSFVAAFAEAAAIGGLADWYAVVALFRRPFGLPVPHTAIIPENKDRIADNLGHFIERNFLSPGAVRAKLKEVDFAMMVADWLSAPHRSATLSNFATRIAPEALAALEHNDQLRKLVAGRVYAQFERVQVAPLAADMLKAITADRHHQRLFDELLRVFGGMLNDEAALASVRDKIRTELPSLANMFKADAYLLKKIVASAGALIEEVQNDLDHPMRREFDRFVERFVDDLRVSPDYADRAERLKRSLLARPELADLAGHFWAGLRSFVEQDMANSNSMLRNQLTAMLVEIGKRLADDPQLRAEMNHGFVTSLGAFVESQKSGVATFISEQVRGWDIVQLTRLIELNIGRDLQYIRFNGMIVGGLAGLCLHIGERLIFG